MRISDWSSDVCSSDLPEAHYTAPMSKALPLHVIVLAAGQGTRMKSAQPKVLQRLGGRPMLGHVIDAARSLDVAGVHVVIGHGADAVRRWADAAYETGAVQWAERPQRIEADRTSTRLNSRH